MRRGPILLNEITGKEVNGISVESSLPSLTTASSKEDNPRANVVEARSLERKSLT